MDYEKKVKKKYRIMQVGMKGLVEPDEFSPDFDTYEDADHYLMCGGLEVCVAYTVIPIYVEYLRGTDNE